MVTAAPSCSCITKAKNSWRLSVAGDEMFAVVTWCGKMRDHLQKLANVTGIVGHDLLTTQVHVDAILYTIVTQGLWRADDVLGKIGVVGPAIAKGDEVVRIIYFDDVVVLVNAAYLQQALSNVLQHPHERCTGAIVGRLITSASDGVSLACASLDASEALDLNNALGVRVWRRSSSPAPPLSKTSFVVASSDALAGRRVAWRQAGSRATLVSTDKL